MAIIGELLIFAIQLYIYAIIANVILSWLLAFDVVDYRHPATQKLLSFFNKILTPVFQPMQRIIPPIGGFDISPIIVIFGLVFLQRLIGQIFYGGLM